MDRFCPSVIIVINSPRANMRDIWKMTVFGNLFGRHSLPLAQFVGFHPRPVRLTDSTL
jgi:hypothetical protein